MESHNKRQHMGCRYGTVHKQNVNHQILEPTENLETYFPNYFLGNMSSG